MEEEIISMKMRLTYNEVSSILDSRIDRYNELIIIDDNPTLKEIYPRVKEELKEIKRLVEERKERGIYFLRDDLGIEIASLEMSNVELDMFFNNEEEVNKIYQ